MSKLLDALPIDKPLIIGIIGGGQLGKMITQEAKRMALGVVILDPNKECPASSVCDKLIIADFKDEQKIYELSKEVDFLTYEIELANSTSLKKLQDQRFPVCPTPDILRIIQNKYRQKTFLKKIGLPVPEFIKIETIEQLNSQITQFGLPSILKSSEDSYDGRGNYIITSKEQIREAFSYFSNKEIYLEKYVHFTKELSIMVARNQNCQISSFPIAENIHNESILHTTLVPARINKDIEKRIMNIIQTLMTNIDSPGIFGIEMFLTLENQILINEIAPRPHNSGHYTIEGCSISQFEQHIRSVINLPLIKPELYKPTVMINILGPKKLTNSHYKLTGLSECLGIQGVKIHIYGKKTTKPNRKLGHITATGLNLEEALKRAIKAKNSINILSI
ncbi:MAG: 5-(carboxyamino)imidazole ribonucleotide synthase [Nitrososphaeraceae archaeon]